MDRRRFCTSMLVCASRALAAGCSPLPIVAGDVRGGSVFVPARSVPGAGAPGVLVRVGKSAQVVTLAQEPDGSLISHSALCTHQGCEIRPEGTMWRCPCHGAGFGRHGEVIRGPAKQDLRPYVAKRIDGGVAIELTAKEMGR